MIIKAGASALPGLQRQDRLACEAQDHAGQGSEDGIGDGQAPIVGLFGIGIFWTVGCFSGNAGQGRSFSSLEIILLVAAARALSPSGDSASLKWRIEKSIDDVTCCFT